MDRWTAISNGGSGITEYHVRWWTGLPPLCVMAIGYNQVTGTPPLSDATGGPLSKGNQIWIHEEPDGPSLGSLGVSRGPVAAMLQWANPAAQPVILMGLHSRVVPAH